MTGRRDIGWRLENWAAVMTGACPRDGVDTADAWRLEQGMRKLETPQRELLRWCYITRAVPEVVCRKLEIPHRPVNEFVERFRQAQLAIQLIVERNNETVNSSAK